MVKIGHSNSNPQGPPEVPFARRQGSSFGVEVLDLARLRHRQLDHSIFRPHRTDFHLLLLTCGGRGWHMVDFVRHPIRRRSVVHIAPGQVQRYDEAGDASGFLVLFQPEAGTLEPRTAGWPTCFRARKTDFQALESVVRVAHGLKRKSLSSPSDRVAWRMLDVILEISHGAAARHLRKKGSARSAEFEAFDALLETEHASHRELSWYARRLGYSERTLSRWSRRTVGASAKAHIDRRVALEAKRLLVHTDHSVESIGSRLGFSEATNFVKFFKRLEGVTPRAFRDSYA